MNYKQYENAINERSWYYSKKYGVDFEDIKSEANIIFFESILTYNKEKGKFITHLYWQLKRLDNIIKDKYYNPKTDVDDCYIEDNKRFNIDYFFELADKEISPEAMKILRYCCDYEWKKLNKWNRTPNYNTLKKTFSFEKFDDCWQELKSFWSNYGEL